MSNVYYNGAGSTITPFTNARAEAVTAQFALVAAAFDKLPAADVLSQARTGFIADSGSPNALMASMSPAPTTLVAGLTIRVRVLAAITGPATLNLNGLGTKAIVHAGGTAVVAGDLNADDIVELLYDGNAFRIMGGGSAADNAAARAQAAAATAINAPGTLASTTQSMTIGTGDVTFTIQTGKAFGIGQTVSIASTADATKQMVGIIKAYNIANGSMTVGVTAIQGTGTFASWAVALSAITSGGITFGNIVGGGLASGGGTAASNQTITVPAALAADILAGTDTTKALTAGALWAAQAYVALTDAATITPDFGAGMNFYVTLGGNRTLANPTNMKVGQQGEIELTQDGAGSRTLAFGSAWRFSGSSTLSTTAGYVDVIAYRVRAVGGTPIIRATLLTND